MEFGYTFFIISLLLIVISSIYAFKKKKSTITILSFIISLINIFTILSIYYLDTLLIIIIIANSIISIFNLILIILLIKKNINVYNYKKNIYEKIKKFNIQINNNLKNLLSDEVLNNSLKASYKFIIDELNSLINESSEIEKSLQKIKLIDIGNQQCDEIVKKVNNLINKNVEEGQLIENILLLNKSYNSFNTLIIEQEEEFEKNFSLINNNKYMLMFIKKFTNKIKEFVNSTRNKLNQIVDKINSINKQENRTDFVISILKNIETLKSEYLNKSYISNSKTYFDEIKKANNQYNELLNSLEELASVYSIEALNDNLKEQIDDIKDKYERYKDDVIRLDLNLIDIDYLISNQFNLKYNYISRKINDVFSQLQLLKKYVLAFNQTFSDIKSLYTKYNENILSLREQKTKIKKLRGLLTKDKLEELGIISLDKIDNMINNIFSFLDKVFDTNGDIKYDLEQSFKKLFTIDFVDSTQSFIEHFFKKNKLYSKYISIEKNVNEDLHNINKELEIVELLNENINQETFDRKLKTFLNKEQLLFKYISLLATSKNKSLLIEFLKNNKEFLAKKNNLYNYIIDLFSFSEVKDFLKYNSSNSNLSVKPLNRLNSRVRNNLYDLIVSMAVKEGSSQSLDFALRITLMGKNSYELDNFYKETFKFVKNSTFEEMSKALSELTKYKDFYYIQSIDEFIKKLKNDYISAVQELNFSKSTALVSFAGACTNLIISNNVRGMVNGKIEQNNDYNELNVNGLKNVLSFLNILKTNDLYNDYSSYIQNDSLVKELTKTYRDYPNKELYKIISEFDSKFKKEYHGNEEFYKMLNLPYDSSFDVVKKEYYKKIATLKRNGASNEEIMKYNKIYDEVIRNEVK